MKVGDSVRLAIDDFERGETESAMLHACNAVDGTSAKLYPKLGNGKRFTKLIRDNYSTLGLMAVRGLNVHETRWPVPVRSTLSTKTLIEWPDTADLIWVIHRCNHGHGDEVPTNFALIDDNIGIASELHVEQGVVRLPWNTVFGMLAVAIGEPVNRGQIAGDGQYLTWGSPEMRFYIADWWGYKAELLAELQSQHTALVKMDWADWTENPPELV